MHRVSFKTIIVSSIVVCLTLTVWPLTTHTSPQKLLQPNFSDKLIVDVPVDSLVAKADTDTRIELVQIPKYARQLDGQRVRMHGMMYPPFKEKGLKHFLFIPETKQRPTAHWGSDKIPLHALIAVTTAKGHSEDDSQRPFIIEGIFKVEIRSDKDKVQFVYHIHNAKIVEKNVRLRFRPAVGMFGC